ncbi:MAG TPA: DUF4426 domain-containing protein [Gammaproteobacteria bacterium]|jgi:hypothetical protein
MGGGLRTLSIGILAALAACGEPQQGPAASADEEVAVLPGTETFKDFGDYTVHFNALVTNQLAPDIAREYGIVRSDSRIMLNVSILQKQAAGTDTPVSGAVSASAINLNGQLRGISMREIREGEAIYYIGELAITDAETLIFTVDVTPLNEASRFTVRFKKQFFVD